MPSDPEEISGGDGDYGTYDLYGGSDIGDLVYGSPPDVDVYDYYGAAPAVDHDPTMYFDEITTTTVPPDMYDYLFAFDTPSRNRVKGPSRKKFDAQALKAAYAAILNKSSSQSQTKSRVTRRSVFESVEQLARQFLQRFTGPAPKVLGLLDRRAPDPFRQNTFVKISLSQFSIVSTGTTGKEELSTYKKCEERHTPLIIRVFLRFYK